MRHEIGSVVAEVAPASDQLTNREDCGQPRPSESEHANIRCELVNHRVFMARTTSFSPVVPPVGLSGSLSGAGAAEAVPEDGPEPCLAAIVSTRAR